jgi:carboxyl-terminal processing protease
MEHEINRPAALNTQPDERSHRSASWLQLLTVSGVLLLVFLLGLGTGVAFARTPLENGVATSGWQWTLGNRAAETEVCFQEDETTFYPEFRTFWEAIRLIQRDFYGDFPTAEEATYEAIRGVVSGLDDPNTSFLTPEEANLFRTNIAGSFEGIGSRVEWDEEADTLRISEPFENQPAWTAGLRRGDLVLAVDGESLVGSDLTAAVNKVRGPKGTQVVLTISRTDVDEPFDVTVTRDRIETPTIATDTLGEAGDIAYIKLNTFNQNAGQLVQQAVEEAVKRNVAGLVFDLRGNSGGLLREAVKVANVFLEDSSILIERFSDGREEIYRTTGQAIAKDLPMVILVNEGSASASEIVAGALQDNARGKLVGTVTYGKGSVQLPHTLQGGGIMRVTVARWYTPNDRTIDGEGLQPDVTVAVDEDETARDSDLDPQLDAALEVLLNEIR